MFKKGLRSEIVDQEDIDVVSRSTGSQEDHDMLDIMDIISNAEDTLEVQSTEQFRSF